MQQSLQVCLLESFTNNEAKRVLALYVKHVKNCIENNSPETVRYKIPYDLTLSLTFSETEDTNVRGVYNDGLNEIKITTVIGSDFSKRQLNDLFRIAQTSIVHELEHKAQRGTFGDRLAKDRAALSPKLQSTNANPTYFFKPTEIEAFVFSLHKRAQKEKRSFSDVLNEFIVSLEKSKKIDSLNAKRLLNKMIAYAKLRYKT